MKEKHTFSIPPYVMLMLVSIVMSFAIAGVYAVTKDTIEAAAMAEQEAARAAVMDGAAYMTEVVLPEDAPVDYAYEAYDESGSLMGMVSQITVVGFGGEIEVTVGMDTTAVITAIEVGGANFSETSGLGAKTREPAFKDQFSGMSGMLVLKQNIDSVTGASVSSGAVVSGVNKAVEYMKTLLPEGTLAVETEELPLSDEEIAVLLPGAQSVVWMGAGAGVTGWWQADNGYIVRATGFGEGPIAVTMGFDAAGVVVGVIIGDENFMETEGRGDGVLADWYKAQFIGRSGAQAYGEGVDAISGATVTSEATLAAINACMTFDPAAPGTAAPATEASVVGEETVSEPAVAGVPLTPVPTSTPDAATEASVVGEETVSEPSVVGVPLTPVPTSTPDAATEASVVGEGTVSEPSVVGVPLTPVPTSTPDAATEASVPAEESEPLSTIAIPSWKPVVPTIVPSAAYTAPDAVTEASIVEESTPTPAPTPTPDAVTEASIPEE